MNNQTHYAALELIILSLGRRKVTLTQMGYLITLLGELMESYPQISQEEMGVSINTNMLFMQNRNWSKQSFITASRLQSETFEKYRASSSR